MCVCVCAKRILSRDRARAPHFAYLSEQIESKVFIFFFRSEIVSHRSSQRLLVRERERSISYSVTHLTPYTFIFLSLSNGWIFIFISIQPYTHKEFKWWWWKKESEWERVMKLPFSGFWVNTQTIVTYFLSWILSSLSLFRVSFVCVTTYRLDYHLNRLFCRGSYSIIGSQMNEPLTHSLPKKISRTSHIETFPAITMIQLFLPAS